MRYIDLEFELLSPAFTGGADQNADAEIRSATIRGLLRWWWRVSEGHRYPDVAAMRDKENKLFGFVSKKPRGSGRSRVQVRILKWDESDMLPKSAKLPESGQWRRGDQTGSADVLGYLGYGPVLNSGTVRPAIRAGATFAVRISWKDGSLGSDEEDSIVRAAACWSCLGGLGCRSRKGFGALHGEVAGGSHPALVSRASDVWDTVSAESESRHPDGTIVRGLPDHPQWASRRLLFVGETELEWAGALGAAGKFYMDVIPKKPRRKSAPGQWIGGTASPRRASTVLVTLTKALQGLQGIVAILPCRMAKDRVGREDVEEFLRRVAQDRRAFLQDIR